MATIRLVGHGIAELAADLHAAGPVVEEKTKVVVQVSGHDCVSRMQVICPVDTGATKSSCGVDFEDGGLGWKAGPTTYYSPYLEYGTSKMAPHAFVNPAFEYAIADAMPMFDQVVEGIL